MKVAVITISDRSYRGEREDKAGPLLIRFIKEHLQPDTVTYKLVPDERSYIVNALRTFCREGYELIVTTGGTGVTTRDVTPEATLEVIERRLPGFEEIMRVRSFEITPHAIISRAVVGICRKTLIINLPGNPKGAVENLEIVLPAIPHTIAKIHDDPFEPGEVSG